MGLDYIKYREKVQDTLRELIKTSGTIKKKELYCVACNSFCLGKRFVNDFLEALETGDFIKIEGDIITSKMR